MDKVNLAFLISIANFNFQNSQFPGNIFRSPWYKNMLQTDEKQKIIKKYKLHDSDTGSTSVQVAILSEEIDQLQGHLKTHKKDNHSRRGLLKKVNNRRRLLSYLKKIDELEYAKLIKKLGLKK